MFKSVKLRLVAFFCLVLTVLIPACKIERLEGGSFNDAADKLVTAFTLKQADSTNFGPEDVSAVITNDSIKVHVPAQTSLNNLIPVITYKAKAIYPASETAQNFTRPVRYTVKAEDGTSKTYTVVVKAAQIKSVVYVGSNNKTFYAIDASTGNQIWKFAANKNWCYSSPIFNNNIVYAAADNTMYALDAATGAVKWSYTAADKIIAAAAYNNGIVYFGSYDHHFVGLDATTGAVKLDITEPDAINTSATISNGVAYFISLAGNLYAVDVQSGTSKKIFKTGGAVFGSSPTISGNIAYVGSDDNNMYAVDVSAGQLKWKFDTEGSSTGFTHPAVSNGVAYFGAAQSMSSNTVILGSLYAVNASTGALIWKKLEHKGFYSSPVIAGDMLYTTCFDGNIYGLNAQTGATKWKSLIYPNSSTTPTVAEGIVYVGSGTGNLYALDAASGAVKWKSAMPGNTFTSAPCVIGTDGAVYSK